MFRRKVYDKLLAWKEKSNGDTALLLEGARRVGKSTIVEEFAKKEYRSYIRIDFAEAPLDVRRLLMTCLTSTTCSCSFSCATRRNSTGARLS